jgi:hypothetical protein
MTTPLGLLIPVQPWSKRINAREAEIVYWSRVTLCNLYYSIPRFSGVGIFFLPMSVRPGVCFRRIGRERLNRNSWNLVALQHMCCLYYVSDFRRDLATDDDPSWATYTRATMKQKNQCKRRKESLGKETDVLYPDEQFDAIALMLGHRLRVVCGGRGEGVSRCFSYTNFNVYIDKILRCTVKSSSSPVKN